jgi:hypothetical protein
MVSWAGARKMKCFSMFCGGLQTWRDTLAPDSTPCYPVQLAGKLNMFLRQVGNSSQCRNLSPLNFLLGKHNAIARFKDGVQRRSLEHSSTKKDDPPISSSKRCATEISNKSDTGCSCNSSPSRAIENSVSRTRLRRTSAVVLNYLEL